MFALLIRLLAGSLTHSFTLKTKSIQKTMCIRDGEHIQVQMRTHLQPAYSV